MLCAVNFEAMAVFDKEKLFDADKVNKIKTHTLLCRVF